MTRAGRRLFVASALALLASACLSPTLPLPPPSRPNVQGPDPQGNVTLDGTVLDGAVVSALNMRTGELRGHTTGTDGHYNFKIPAQIGDDMELWYSVGTYQSPSIVFSIGK